MHNISKKVICTVRKYESEVNIDGIVNRIDKLYKLNIRRYRFNLGKLIRKATMDYTIETILKIRSRYNDIVIMVDIGYPGSAVRLNLLRGEKKKRIHSNEKIFFVSSCYKGKKTKNTIVLNAESLGKLFTEQQKIYYGSGEASFIVEKIISKDKVIVKSTTDITVMTNTSIKCQNFIKKKEPDALTIDFINKTCPDEVALSFVESAEDIKKLKRDIKCKTQIVSKIETYIGIKNFNEIVQLSDAIMLARGDLGFNVDCASFNYYQNMVIQESLENEKGIYIATDILGSYCEKEVPSRGDLIDLANIIRYDVSGIILNGDLLNSNNVKAAFNLIEDMYNNKIKNEL